jgi:hypothetical protein
MLGMLRLAEKRKADITMLGQRVAWQAAYITKTTHSSLALAAQRRWALDQAMEYVTGTVGNVWKSEGRTRMRATINAMLESEPTWDKIRADVGTILEIPAHVELSSEDVLNMAVGLMRDDAKDDEADGASASNENSAASIMALRCSRRTVKDGSARVAACSTVNRVLRESIEQATPGVNQAPSLTARALNTVDALWDASAAEQSSAFDPNTDERQVSSMVSYTVQRGNNHFRGEKKEQTAPDAKKHLTPTTMKCRLQVVGPNGEVRVVTALIDSGAEVTVMDAKCVPADCVIEATRVNLTGAFDGNDSGCGRTKVSIMRGEVQYPPAFCFTTSQLQGYDLILGIDWLRSARVSLSYSLNPDEESISV